MKKTRRNQSPGYLRGYSEDGIPAGFSPKQVADALGVSYITVLNEVKRGNLRALHAGSRIILTAGDVEAWLKREQRDVQGDAR